MLQNAPAPLCHHHVKTRHVQKGAELGAVCCAGYTSERSICSWWQAAIHMRGTVHTVSFSVCRRK